MSTELISEEYARRRTFLAFEGGGAKGLVHLGALHAIEESKRFDIQGFAGTSAGAMVATLAAAGWQAETLLPLGSSPEEKPADHILDQLGLRDATEIFGAPRWRSLLQFRALWAGGWRHLVTLAFRHTSFACVLALLFGHWGVHGALVLAVGEIGALIWLLLHGGTRLDGVRDAFDRALWLKFPALAAKQQRVTFADLPLLKVCASNLTERRLEVFSAQTTPGIPVADAVCASICYPFAFRPWEIEMPDGRGTQLFLDGGLLSNLPAWPFDEERRLDPQALTLAFAIGPTAEKPKRPSPRNWISAMLPTALFGAAMLSTRGAGAIQILPLRTDIDLFAFDLSREEARREVTQARDAMQILLNREVLGVPDRIRRRNADIRDRVAAWQGRNSGVFGRAPEPDSVRVALAVPEDHLVGGLLPVADHHRARTLTLRFGAGFEDWADDGMVIPVAGTTVGTAWSAAQQGLPGPTLQFLDELDPAFQGMEGLHLRRRLRPGLAWILAIPVTRPFNRHYGVLVIDSVCPVRPLFCQRHHFLTKLKSLISDEIMPILDIEQ
ncbi:MULTISPECIES: patatin-like phospholipase family protein [Roseomonadaceae]|uniref:Patatin-like phospholipase family protein n=1 Tax=Falsiroseomonas oleicola TaxID=2801474 RepID=A0ABS6HBH9_9PROT|nr:patatin-like phospholipase family protein [Roseomonas oleicola]MBU8546082.1 patatin-like phospholipase family protein [Roseomonas oleicola]